MAKSKPQEGGKDIFNFISYVPLPPSNPALPIVKDIEGSVPNLDVPLQSVLEDSNFTIPDVNDIVVIVVPDEVVCVKVDVNVDANVDVKSDKHTQLRV